jgi:antitoxin VapB
MKTKTFKSGNSEAVRIPAEMAYGPNTELEITRNGDVIILRPSKAAHALREAVALLRSMPKPETIELLDRTQSRDTLDDL